MNLRAGSVSLMLIVASCSSGNPVAATSDVTSGVTPVATLPASLPAIFAKFAATVAITLEGETVVLRTDDIPNHGSPYFGVGDPRYLAPQDGMVVNPNRILAQSYVLRVPASPSVATPSDTPLDAIGIAVNGVVLFNQYAAGFSPLDNERQTFDVYNGHPAPRGNYHYHIEPVAITSASQAALVGVLLDGFPIYGPRDQDGTVPSDLDACNGHLGVTDDYPQGIYHYHVTTTVPYLSGCFRGSPGSATN